MTSTDNRIEGSGHIQPAEEMRPASPAPSPISQRVLRKRDASTPIIEKDNSIIESEDGDETLTEIDDRNANIPESTINGSELETVAQPTNFGGKNISRTKNPVEKVCNDCKYKVVYNIKCHHCPKILCFNCTMLPRENFLYFFLTASQYRCTDCCVVDLTTRKNINLETHGANLEEEIEKMKSCYESSAATPGILNQSQVDRTPTPPPPSQLPPSFPHNVEKNKISL